MTQLLTRRRFVAGAATLAAVTTLPLSAPAAGETVGRDRCGSCGTFACDVVVVGAGAAGLSAAIEASEAGASVIVLEKMPQVGGNSLLAAEAVLVADSVRNTDAPLDRDAVRADVQRFLEAIRERGRTADETLDRILLERSGEALAWLRRLGCGLSVREPVPGFSRVHEFRPDGVPVGMEIMRHLLYRAERLGVPVLTRHRVTSVTHREDAGGLRIEARDQLGRGATFFADAAVLATGGYAGSLDMIRRFRTDAPQLMTTNAASATGDGIQLAHRLGAGFRDLDAVVMQPTTDPLSGAILPKDLRTGGGILVNAEGRRFVNELARPEEVSAAILKQPDGFAWLVADRTVGAVRRIDEDLLSPFGWHVDATILSLAKTLDINFYALSATLEACRTTRCTGRVEHARPLECSAITVPPFHSIRVRPAYHGTPGGILVDERARVLRQSGERIPGIFAAGEATGGVCGISRLDNVGLIEAVVFGRIAGTNAASFARPRGR